MKNLYYLLLSLLPFGNVHGSEILSNDSTVVNKKIINSNGSFYINYYLRFVDTNFLNKETYIGNDFYSRDSLLIESTRIDVSTNTSITNEYDDNGIKTMTTLCVLGKFCNKIYFSKNGEIESIIQTNNDGNLDGWQFNIDNLKLDQIKIRSEFFENGISTE
ncbi:MAG: hypothetical protein RI922_1783 [Bacteroidota bacterium]|jgi:hypothetical protein